MTVDLSQPVHRHLPIRDDLPAATLRGFLDEMALGRDQLTTALIFADWLEEQDDARSQAVRWSVWKAQPGHGSAIHQQVTTLIREWMDFHSVHLIEELPRGVRLDWKRGLLCVRINTTLLTLQDPFPWEEIQELIDAGWLVEGTFWGRQQSSFLQATLARWAGLLRVELDNPEDAALESLEDLPSLRELRLVDADQLRPFVFNSLRAHPHLEALEIQAGTIERLSLYDMPTLRDLRMYGCDHLAHLFLRNLPGLESFYLAGRTNLSEFAPGELPSLRRITLNGVEGNPVNRVVLQGYPALREIVLHNVYWLSILSLTHLPALSHLDTSGSDMVRLTLEGLPSLERLCLGKLPDLHQATLRDLPRLTELRIDLASRLEQLTLEEVPRLRTLVLSGCERLRAEIRQQLRERIPEVEFGG